MFRAGIVLRKVHLFPADDIDDDKPTGKAGCSLNGIRKTAAHLIINDKAVDYNLNGVLDVLFQLDFFFKVIEVAIYPYAGKPAAGRCFKLFYVGTFSAPHHRREHLKTSSLRQFENSIHHLVDSLLFNHPTAYRTVWHADARIEQTQVVINLGYGANGGTRVARSSLLVDGDSRRKSFDGIHIGLVHLAQKLTCIAGKTLYIAALSIGVNRIERKAGFAAARKTSHYNQLVTRQGYVDIF